MGIFRWLFGKDRTQEQYTPPPLRRDATMAEQIQHDKIRRSHDWFERYRETTGA